MRAYRIAYDGSEYHGFQRQPDVSTVEGTILNALCDLSILGENEDVPPGYAAAGRTDAGVSALAQTIGFEAPDWLTPSALNSELPADVRAWAVADAPAEFHAQYDATRREYVYYLYAPDAERAAAREALDLLSGRHDVHNLTPDDRGTERTLSTDLVIEGPFLVIRIEGSGFPRQLVRRVVGLVSEVAAGEAESGWIERVLSPEPLTGPDGIAPASPEPLLLADVRYPTLSFEPDRDAAAVASMLFEQKRVERMAAARVAGTIAEGIGESASGSDSR